jgi:hypothetical protein
MLIINKFTSTLIIRSAGERTLELCKKLILELGVPEKQVFVVKEVPFSAAMRKSFEIGISENRKWTFCVDADVLLRQGSIAHMLSEAEKQAENVCEIQGLVMDKFFGGPRPAGNHLYRTSLLPEVIKRIPEEGVNIRPEYYTLLSMANDGYPWLQIPYIVGTHDEEQFNFDIYRKCYVQAVKHLELAGLFIPLWKRNIGQDKDFAMALQAFSDSIKYTGELYINSKQTVYLDGFGQSGIAEKAVLNAAHFSLEAIEQTIQNWEEPPEYKKYFPDRFGLKLPSDKEPTETRGQRFKQIISEKGVFRGMLLIKARILISLGHRLQRII